MQLGDSWFEKEQLLAEAAKKDKQRMEELNKVLTNVSRIRSFPCEHCLMILPIQRPPLTMQDRAAFAKVTVDVYYQDETQGGLVGVDKVARKFRCFPFAPFGMYSTICVMQSRSRALPA